VVGASAGGVAALKTLVSELPETLAAAVFIVLHVPAGSVSRLPEILNHAKRLPAAHAANGERIRGGRIYIAPPDHHLLIDGAYVRVMRGPKENRQRPAIDPLFRSAAMSHAGRVIGVVLTGALDDGTAGLAAIKDAGGIAIVQDPDDADTPDMPRSALAHVDVDFCLPLRAIAAHLTDLVQSPVPPSAPSEPAHGTARIALRLMQENASLSRRVASRAADRGHPLVAQRFLDRAAEMEFHAGNLKDTLLRLEGLASELAVATPDPTD
jgi:two-component system, chemotaxis family, protein-glutamate methylesterase/glutaminase